MGVHHTFMATHNIAGGAPRSRIWKPRNHCGRPRMFVDIQAIVVLDAHKSLWAVTRNLWAPKERQLLGDHTRNMDCHHALMGDRDTFCGHPAHYRGRSRYAYGVPRLFLGAHEKNVDFHAFWVDCRNIFVDVNETCVGDHGKYVEPHAFSWATTITLWVSTAYLWAGITALWAPMQRCGGAWR